MWICLGKRWDLNSVIDLGLSSLAGTEWNDMGGHEGLLLVLNEAISRLEKHSYHLGNQLIGKFFLGSRIVVWMEG